MPLSLRWWKKGAYRLPTCGFALRPSAPLLEVEVLERRLLLSGDTLLTATPLNFAASQTVQAANFLATPNEVDLYRLSLNQGDEIQASISAQSAGSGLTSLLRVFDSNGTQLALDDQEGGDPQLTFQAPTQGTWYVGVSSAPDDNYNPNVAGSGSNGTTTGLYTLNVQLTPATPLLPDLAGGSFRLGTTTAAWGDTIPVSFTVENRGGAAAGAFAVEVLVSTSSGFANNPNDMLLTVPVSGLAAGASYTLSGLSIQLPSLSTATTDNLPASGPVIVGMWIDPVNSITELNPADQSGVHRGADLEKLTIVTPVVATGNSTTLTDPNSRVNTTLPAGQTDSYQVTVGQTGLLSVQAVAVNSTLVPRLTLAGQGGVVLMQSDSGSLTQQVEPGTYEVTGLSGTGNSQLTSEFVPDNPPSAPVVPLGPQSQTLATLADVNSDGIPDLITAQAGSASPVAITVFLGVGNGAFQPGSTYAVDVKPPLGFGNFESPAPLSLTVADLTGDGHPDIILGLTNSQVGVMLNSGDGTFVGLSTDAVGNDPTSVTVADLDGDGKPDLVAANQSDGTLSVLLGYGDGTFQPQQTYAVGKGPAAVTVADVNGDGKPDILATNSTDGTVSVLLENGNGTFQSSETVNVGSQPTALAVADLTGSGEPDLIVFNSGSSTVDLLAGNGNGTFQPPEVYAVGPQLQSANASNPTPQYGGGANTGYGGGGQSTVIPPSNVELADVNRDGLSDVIVANPADNTVSVLLNNGKGAFEPEQTLNVGMSPQSFCVMDVNGDGKADLMLANRDTGNAFVLVGNGDGTFQSPSIFPVGSAPSAVGVADLNGDGQSDLAVANKTDSTVSVLLGNGDGTFQNQQTLAAGQSKPDAVAGADVNGDGLPDLIVANRGSDTVSIFLGSYPFIFGGFGSKPGSVSLVFSGQPLTYAVGAQPSAVVAVDLNADNLLDLVVTNGGSNTISVLRGNGDGTFQSQVVYAVGLEPTAVAVADVNDDGIPDLIVTNSGSNTVSILLGNGDGTFQPQKKWSVGSVPSAVAVADLNGQADLVITNSGSNTVSILLGNGDGTFQSQRTYAVGTDPTALTIADVNGDNQPDLVVTNGGSNTVSVLFGNGNGTFQAQQTWAVGAQPSAVAVADINGDSQLDLIVSNSGSNTVSVLLGNGDGTFQPQQTWIVGAQPSAIAIILNVSVPFGGGFGQTLPEIVVADQGDDTVSFLLGNRQGDFAPQSALDVGPQPTGVTIADLNNDGRPDLVVANSGNGSVGVLLGNGDGTFQAATLYAVGPQPSPVAVADLTSNGKSDLIVTNRADGTVSVLLGNGDGTFQPQQTFAVGASPTAVALADLNGDGRLDLIVTNSGDGTVGVLLGNGDGTFQPQQTYAVGNIPVALAVADFDADGKEDIIAVNTSDNTVSVLLGNGDGTFQPQQTWSVGATATAIAVADLNDDGHPDLVVTNSTENTVSVLLDNGDGTFQPQQTFAVGNGPSAVAIADVNRDGRPDIVVTNSTDGTVSVLLGNGDGTFSASTPQSGVGVRDTPFLVDLNGDSMADTVILNAAGDILFRQGLSSNGNSFAPPVTLNVGRPARDTTVLPLDSGWAVAAADALPDPTLSKPNHSVYTVSLYTVAANGAVTRSTAFTTGDVPTRIAAADLTGDGLDDLIVTNALDDTVSIAFQTAPGVFSAPTTFAVGLSPSDIRITDVNGDGLPDIVVSDQASGAVSVLLNAPTHSFASVESFRSGLGLSDAEADPSVSSLDKSVSLVAGDFTSDGRQDLVVVNQDAHSLSVLANAGTGGFADPRAALTTATSDGFAINNQAGAVVAADFNNDGKLDLAILMEDTGQVWIFTGHGDGTFSHTFTIAVGPLATGLTVVPGSGPDLYDLLVGNEYGDILRIVGNGDGTFRPYQRVENNVPLAVADLQGNGQDDFIFANQSFDQVTVQYGSSAGLTTLANAQSAQPVLGPGAVKLTDLNGDGIPDLIVANSGSNNVLVFLGNANGTFQAARSFFAGDNPVGITVADLNGDGVPDLVIANEGSNDVSILYGKGTGSNWTMTYGPRLKTGGLGPVSTVVQPAATPGGAPDILASNSVSNDVGLVPGVGQGLFNDQNPTLLTTGLRPGQIAPVVTPAGTGFVVLNTGGSTLTEFTGFNGTGFTTTRTINTGGFNPVFVIAFDLNNDGSTDLLIANENTGGFANADGSTIGNIVLLEPGADGSFEPEETFTDPELPDPTALALSALHGENEFYATTAGVERAFPFFFEPAEPVRETTQLVPLPNSDIGFVPQVVTQVPLPRPDSDLLLPTVKAPDESIAAGQSGGGEISVEAATLANLSLFASAQGGSGNGDNWLERIAGALDSAQRTWLPSVAENAAGAWQAFSESVTAVEDGAGFLLRSITEPTGLAHLEMPDLHWGALGGQMLDATFGSVRATVTGSGLSELGQRFQNGIAEAAAPWLPAAELPTVPSPALEGGATVLRGLNDLLQSAVPDKVPLRDILDALSPALRPTPEVPAAPKALEPVLLASAERRSEWEAFWLALAVVVLPEWRKSRASRYRPQGPSLRGRE